MARRTKKNPLGSIRTLPSGKHNARYSHKGHSVQKTFLRIGDAEDWLDGEEDLISKGKWLPPRQREAKEKLDQKSVGTFLTEYLAEKEAADALKPSTLAKYREQIKYRIEGHDIYDTPVTEVTKATVRNWWTTITIKHATMQTNNKAYILLRTAFDALVERDIISENPVSIPAKDRKIKRTYKEEEPLTMDELRALYKACPERYKIITALCFFHGLRIGEALAVRRKNVIVSKDGRITVKVEDNLQRIDGKMVSMEGTKTEAGMRTVTIAPAFHADFLDHLNRSDDDYLTTTRNGTPLSDDNYRRVLKDMKTKTGIEKRVHPHAGRYALVTELSEKGYEPKVIGKMIGDKDLKTVLGIYAKVTDKRQEFVAEEYGKTVTL